MKIVVAPDSYKGCLGAIDVARHIEKGIRRVLPDATVVLCPMSDGGEGTVTCVAGALNLRVESIQVADPLGRPVNARFLQIKDSALIEMAEASGMERLTPAERNPMRAHTRGTGELICHGLNLGIRDFTITVGGSATVDGGMGMANALGYRFLDTNGRQLIPSGEALLKIASIDTTQADRRIHEATFRVATDVSSPLLGPGGAARQFGPQKGATPHMVAELERGLAALQAHLAESGLLNPVDAPGDGAAGGLGMGIRGFLNGTIVSGAQTVAELAGLEQHLEDADFVVTGEGRTDGQSAAGKLCDYVERLARAHSVPTLLLSGQITDDASGFVSRFKLANAITPAGIPLETAIANAAHYLKNAAAAAFAKLI